MIASTLHGYGGGQDVIGTVIYVTEIIIVVINIMKVTISVVCLQPEGGIKLDYAAAYHSE